MRFFNLVGTTRIGSPKDHIVAVRDSAGAVEIRALHAEPLGGKPVREILGDLGNDLGK
jgi:hypothetical protein